MLATGLSLAGASLIPAELAEAAPPGFEQWRDKFRARATARGVSDATYTRVMGRIEPDMGVFALIRNQPEFNEQIWQYINRRVSDWRLTEGKKTLQAVFAACSTASSAISASSAERPAGAVGRGVRPMAIRSCRRTICVPCFRRLRRSPGRAAAARLLGDRAAQRAGIVERGWGTPDEMRGSWAGAMGHTQWMPEVWLNVGIDYDGDGRVSPFGSPDDALGSSARYLVNRGKYRRNEHWGYEVKTSGGPVSGSRSYEEWASLGVKRADGQAFAQP